MNEDKQESIKDASIGPAPKAICCVCSIFTKGLHCTTSHNQACRCVCVRLRACSCACSLTTDGLPHSQLLRPHSVSTPPLTGTLCCGRAEKVSGGRVPQAADAEDQGAEGEAVREPGQEEGCAHGFPGFQGVPGREGGSCRQCRAQLGAGILLSVECVGGCELVAAG